LSVSLVLVSAVLLFGTVMTGFALLRLNAPWDYTWAPTLLDRKLGIVGAASLLLAFVCAGGALRLARSKPVASRVLLLVAVLAGAATMAARFMELPAATTRAGLVRHTTAGKPAPRSAPAAVAKHVGDAAAGKRIFLGTCAACHAPDGVGVKGQGQNLRDSTFFTGKSDEQALTFVKTGRQPFDPDSKLHLAMPARGGNPTLTDANLLDTIAFVREIQKAAAASLAAGAKAPSAVASGAPGASTISADQPRIIDGELWLPHSVVPAASAGPPGSARATIALQRSGAQGRLAGNVERFFTIFLFVTGLHTIYLVFGLVLATTLVVTGRRATIAALTIAAAYWLAISAIGLLLLPAFYV
jgi:mono/diheme cytochrome c family protein